MLSWHELVERDHELQNPTSAEKIRLAGAYMRLGPHMTVLDVACGKAGPALILAREFGCRIYGIDVSAVFVEQARQRIAASGLQGLVSVKVADATHAFDRPSCDAALCLGAAFVWGHIGDAAAVLRQFVGDGGAIAVGEPFWRETGRTGGLPGTTSGANGFVDLAQTVARFEAAGIEPTGMVAASEDDWDRYASLQWRAAVEIGCDDVMQRHLSQRDNYLSARRSQLGWAIFTGRVR